MVMTMEQAQADMRRGYYSGATGIVASALAWAVAAGVAAGVSPTHGIWALLLGGVLIFPVGLLLCRLLGALGTHSKGNPLGQLAGASTFWLIFSLPIAYGLGLSNPSWFFLAMLLTIGGRYLVFASLYGMRLYWVLGLTLAVAAVVLALTRSPLIVVVAAGAAVEFAFGAAALVQHRQWAQSSA